MSAQVSPTSPTVSNGTVKSVFAHLDCLVEGIDALKRAGIRDFIVTSPLPRHEIEEQIYEGRPSPVRWFTMIGAIFGGTFGFALCSFTHPNWAMIIPAGKPLVSIPPFLIITFESTVLWGCLFTLVGMMLLARLPGYKLQVEAQDPRFSDDVFGLVVNNLGRKQAKRVSEMLNTAGAVEAEDGYGPQSAPSDAATSPEQLGFEPDNPNTDMLIRIAVGVTIIILGAITGMSWYFHKTVGEELNARGYSTTERAVSPDHRPNERD